jgi:hypothetical protein
MLTLGTQYFHLKKVKGKFYFYKSMLGKDIDGSNQEVICHLLDYFIH